MNINNTEIIHLYVFNMGSTRDMNGPIEKMTNEHIIN